MGEGVRCHTGGIRGLLEELDRHGEAIEHDLVAVGWTLDDVPRRLNWRAFARWVRQNAQQRGSALYRELVGDDHVWGLNEQLLASVVDVLNRANWQRAQGKGPRPKPIPRPGVRPLARKVGGTTLVPLAEAQRIFARHNGRSARMGAPGEATAELVEHLDRQEFVSDVEGGRDRHTAHPVS